MTKKTRLIILLVCVACFFIAAPIIIGYSLGYRIDFEEMKIVATGGIFVKVWPQLTEVFIDSRLAGKTNMLSSSVFSQNLLPKPHIILIKKEGYFDYQKTLEVKEKEVTKLEHVILFKQNLALQPLIDKTQSPFAKEDQFIIKNKNLYENSKTATKPLLKNVSLFDVSGNNIIWLGIDGGLYKSDLSGKTQDKIFEAFYSPIKNIKVSPDSTKLLYYNDYEILYSYLDPNNPEQVFLNRFSEKITDSQWLNDNYIIFTINGKIKITEIDNRDNINIVEISSEFKNPKIIFNQQDKKLYVLTGDKGLVSEPLLP